MMNVSVVETKVVKKVAREARRSYHNKDTESGCHGPDFEDDFLTSLCLEDLDHRYYIG